MSDVKITPTAEHIRKAKNVLTFVQSLPRSQRKSNPSLYREMERIARLAMAGSALDPSDFGKLVGYATAIEIQQKQP